MPHLAWYSIRNASDPQIANRNDDIDQAAQQAASIYVRYGGLTTASQRNRHLGGDSHRSSLNRQHKGDKRCFTG
jgi:hypothetical protein